jgi:DNA-binding XRE family transcriptional regulator
MDWEHQMIEKNPIRRYRRLLDVSRRSLGVLLGVTEQTIGAWEMGSYRPGIAHAEELQLKTGITLESIDEWTAEYRRLLTTPA